MNAGTAMNDLDRSAAPRVALLCQPCILDRHGAQAHGRHGRAALWPLVLSVALTATLGPVGATAQQDSAGLTPLLDRVSFNSAEKPETLGKDLAELDAAGFAKLCDMLVEPGAGDDTKPRMALSALTWYLGSVGTAAQRDDYIDVLCQALESDKPPPVKAFLVRQLQLAGTERAVPALAKLLEDERLYGPAAQALLAIGGEDAARAFRQALRRTAGARRIAMIDALGTLRDRAAGGSLKRVFSEDEPSRGAALSALAALGQAGELATTMLASAPPDAWYRRCILTVRLLESLESAAELGRKPADAVARECRGLLRAGDKAAHFRCAALYLLAKVAGAGAVDQVVEDLTSPNPEVRSAAIDVATTLAGPDVTEAYLRRLRSANPASRVAILAVLAQRGDARAFPAAVEALKNGNQRVRLAAVAAVAALGKEKSVRPLVAFLNTDEAAERAAAEDALTGLAGAGAARQIAGALAAQPARVRTALLNVLTRRRASAQLNTFYAFTADEDADVRVAAIRAVGELADESAALRLLALLRNTRSAAEREALEAALAATCGRAGRPALRTAPIVAALDRKNTANYCSLLRVLGCIGGPQALAELRQAASDARAEVRQAAIRAFRAWPDATAAGPLLEIARDAKELKYHVLALRAYARLVGLDADRPAGETLRLCTAGLAVARRPDERKLLLSKLADIKDAAALDVLAPYLEDEQLRDEAASAMITVADGLLPAGWHDARPALEKVLAATDTERVRKQAEQVLKRVSEFEDFITDWQVSGPYRRGRASGNKLFDVTFPPEDPDAKGVQWKTQPVSRDPARYWFIDLVRSCGGSHPVGYLRTYIWSPKEQRVLLELGSDDGIKVWLNREVIHANNVLRPVGRAQDRVDATLNEGWNELLLKVTNNGGGWGACLRVRAPGGGRVDGLKTAARRAP